MFILVGMKKIFLVYLFHQHIKNICDSSSRYFLIKIKPLFSSMAINLSLYSGIVKEQMQQWLYLIVMLRPDCKYLIVLMLIIPFPFKNTLLRLFSISSTHFNPITTISRIVVLNLSKAIYKSWTICIRWFFLKFRNELELFFGWITYPVLIEQRILLYKPNYFRLL